MEGAEQAVIEGARAVLANTTLRCLILETVEPSVEAILRGAGFEGAWYDPFSRRLSEQPNGLASNNTIFVRDWPFVADRLETGKRLDVLGHTLRRARLGRAADGSR